jgi:osomolarity two-component system sensor histidine kinase TcsA
LLRATIGAIKPEAIPAPNIPTLYGALRVAYSTKEALITDGIPPQGNVPYDLRVTPIREQSTLLFFVLEAQSLFKQAASYQHTYLNETYKIRADIPRYRPSL